MNTDDQIRRAFPSLDDIADDEIRTSVCEAWLTAIADNDIASLESVPWFPPVQRKLNLPDETLVAHVRDVTAGAVALAELLIDQRDADIDMDVLLAGALVHDVSKLYEFDGMDETPVGTFLGHPHYGVHVVSVAGLPVEVAHIVLSHTSRTTVEPATLEAELVRRADETAAAAIRWEALLDLRDA